MPIIQKKRAWILFLILWVGPSCQGESEKENVLVMAWGKPLITQEAFQTLLAGESPECQHSKNASCLALRRRLLDQMIEEALVRKIAEDRGVEVSTADLEKAEKEVLKDYEESEDMLQELSQYPEGWRSSVQERLIVHGLFQEILQGLRVRREDALAYFMDHRELFVRPREVRIRQIVVARGDEALEILERLKKGEDFALLAKEYSLSPEAVDGGDLGFLRPGQMPPELEDVAFSLEVGRVSKVIPSPYGFHIVRVEERREPRELEFSGVESKIRRRLLLDLVQKAYRIWVQEKWEEAQIQIMDSSMVPDGGEGESIS
jgi:parvulin-like peptidyl-prolyl isomerase